MKAHDDNKNTEIELKTHVMGIKNVGRVKNTNDKHKTLDQPQL